jgi:hypothetical protein
MTQDDQVSEKSSRLSGPSVPASTAAPTADNTDNTDNTSQSGGKSLVPSVESQVTATAKRERPGEQPEEVGEQKDQGQELKPEEGETLDLRHPAFLIREW